MAYKFSATKNLKMFFYNDRQSSDLHLEFLQCSISMSIKGKSSLNFPAQGIELRLSNKLSYAFSNFILNVIPKFPYFYLEKCTVHHVPFRVGKNCQHIEINSDSVQENYRIIDRNYFRFEVFTLKFEIFTILLK